MGSCLVEVRYIRIEDALELLLMQDEHMIEAFLSYAPGETAHRWRWLGERDRAS